MTLFKDIVPYFDNFIHVYGRNMWSPLTIWTPKKFTIDNFRHPEFPNPGLDHPAFKLMDLSNNLMCLVLLLGFSHVFRALWMASVGRHACYWPATLTIAVPTWYTEWPRAPDSSIMTGSEINRFIQQSGFNTRAILTHVRHGWVWFQAIWIYFIIELIGSSNSCYVSYHCFLKKTGSACIRGRL